MPRKREACDQFLDCDASMLGDCSDVYVPYRRTGTYVSWRDQHVYSVKVVLYDHMGWTLPRDLRAPADKQVQQPLKPLVCVSRTAAGPTYTGPHLRR